MNNKARLERLESRIDHLELFMNISFALEDTVIPADNTRMGSQLSGGKLVSYKYTNNYNSDFKDVGMDELYSEGRFYNCLFSGQHVDLTS